MNHDQQNEALQLIADEKDMEALYDVADETSCNEDSDCPFHAIQDGIHAGLSNGKNVWNYQVREKPGTYVVLKFAKGNWAKAPVAKLLKAEGYLKGYDKNSINSVLAAKYGWGWFSPMMKQTKADGLKPKLEALGLTIKIEDYEEGWDTSSHGFLIGKTFNEVKARLEALPDRKKN